MGQGKSKDIEDGEIGNEQVENQEKGIAYTEHPTFNADLPSVKRERQRVNEDRKLRRKWRRKQGYSLPVGFDNTNNSDGEASGMAGSSFKGRKSSHSKDKDSSVDGASLISQDDAILVSYKKDPEKSDSSVPFSTSVNYRENEKKSRHISKDKSGSKKDLMKTSSKSKYHKRFEDAAALHNHVGNGDHSSPSVSLSTNDDDYQGSKYEVNAKYSNISNSYKSNTKVDQNIKVLDESSYLFQLQPQGAYSKNDNWDELKPTSSSNVKIGGSSSTLIPTENIHGQAKNDTNEYKRVIKDIDEDDPYNNMSCIDKNPASVFTTSVVPSNMGTKTVVEIGSFKPGLIYIDQQKTTENETKLRANVSHISINENTSATDKSFNTNVTQTTKFDNAFKNDLTKISNTNYNNSNSITDLNSLDRHVSDPTQQLKEEQETDTSKSNTNMNSDASNYEIKEGVASALIFNHATETTTTKPCINNDLEQTGTTRYGKQIHQNNSDDDNTTKNNNTTIIHNSNDNCLTPTTTNDLRTLSMDDPGKESPTMIKNEGSTPKTLLLKCDTDVDNSIINAFTNTGISDNNYTENNLVHRDNFVTKRASISPEHKISQNPEQRGSSLDIYHDNNKPQMEKKLSEVLEQTFGVNDANVNIDDCEDVGQRNRQNIFHDNNHSENNDENINGEENNGNYGTELKKNNDYGRHLHDNAYNDDDVENSTNESVKKPKIGKKIHEKMILFDSKVSFHPSNSNNTIESLEKRNIPYLYTDNTPSISNAIANNRTSTRDSTDTCQDKAVKKSIYKLPLPTEITHILESGSAPKILECQNLNEFSTNADKIKSENLLPQLLINAKEYVKNEDRWVNEVQDDDIRFEIGRQPSNLEIEYEYTDQKFNTNNKTSDQNIETHLVHDSDNFSILPTHTKQKKDINRRIKHLLDDSAILIDIDDDVNEEDFEGHCDDDFHHAMMARVDSIPSDDMEPDLSFMPRIEEREEDFLESTVDDESDNDERISISTPVDAITLDSPQPIYDDAHANKKYEKLPSRGSNTAGDLVSVNTPRLHSPHMEMGKYSVEKENSFRNSNDVWEAKKSDTTHDKNHSAHYETTKLDNNSGADNLHILHEAPGTQENGINENRDTLLNEHTIPEQRIGTNEIQSSVEGDLSIFTETQKEVNVSEMSSQIDYSDIYNIIEHEELISSNKECIPNIVETSLLVNDVSSKIDPSTSFDICKQDALEKDHVLKKVSITDINESANNNKVGHKRVKQKSITIITMDDNIGEIDKILYSEPPPTLETREYYPHDTERIEWADRCGEGMENDDDVDIYDEHCGTPVDDSDEHTSDISYQEGDLQSGNEEPHTLQNEGCVEESNNEKEFMNPVSTPILQREEEHNQRQDTDKLRNSMDPENVTTDEDTESDNVTLSPYRERKWTTSTDRSFNINNQKRLPPVGCSSDDLQSNSSNSSTFSTNGGVSASVACYDSLEDLGLCNKEASSNQVHPSDLSSPSMLNHEHGKRQKRSLPQIPVDFSRQQQRAFEILANNYTIQNPPIHFWNQGTELFPQDEPNNPILYPARHVEGRCDDQEYFASVNDSHKNMTNTMFNEVQQSEEENYFSPDNNFQIQDGNNGQRKRQLPQIPGNENVAPPIEDRGNFTETSIDIEADEILRYRVEKYLEPSEMINTNDEKPVQNIENKRKNSTYEESPIISVAGFNMAPKNISGDDSGCASMELPKLSSSPQGLKDSESPSNFLWFSIDELEPSKTPQKFHSLKGNNRGTKSNNTSMQIKTERTTRDRKQSLRNEKLLRSAEPKSSHLKARAASFSGISSKKLAVSKNNTDFISGISNKIKSEKQSNLTSDVKQSLSVNSSSVNIIKTSATRPWRSLTSNIPPNSPKIDVGDTVKIHQNSRIHSAVVSGINVETRSVTVEWFERGETKGKEIELEAILSLNQDLAPQNDNSNGVPNKLSKYIPRPSATANNRQATGIPTAASGSTNGNTGSTTAASGGGNVGGIRTRNKTNRQTVTNLELQAQTNASTEESTMPPPSLPTANAPLSNGSENIPPQRGQVDADTVGKAAGGVNRRRSNVVKEVERLKKNREDRRAKQAEVIEEKVAQKNIDPGNPNWEFMCMINEYQETLEFTPIKDGDAYINHQISVCVRKRPLSNKEIKRKEVDVICNPNQNQVIVHEPKTKVDLTKYLDNQHFRFDYAFDESATNELVYKYTARPLVQNIFEGGMATCFAYGQTGSGKTHTMGGEFHGKTQDSKNGIYAMATKDVFKYLGSPKYKNLKLQVSCSYFEIYSGKVFDLLSGKSKLRVLEDGKQQVVVVGLTEKVVTCVEDVLKLISGGNVLRTSGQTSANAHSSRSHAVFQIILRNTNPKKTLYGKFSLIDLAGNERGADTSSANRQTRMEGAEINKSLLALKECIRALGRKGSHLPFRASKLTQVLRDSFIGEKSKTCMIAMVSPTLSCCEHSLNTMRYADRVKELGAANPNKAGNENEPRQLDESNGHMMESEDTNGVMQAMRDDGVLSPEDSDLAQLRSLNEGELSADWYNFQEAISHLQLLEEELVESHRSTIVGMQQWTKDDLSLLNMTNEVDYDQDAYCQQLEDMIAEKIDTFTALREKARNFRKCLTDEEAKSRTLMNRNF